MVLIERSQSNVHRCNERGLGRYRVGSRLPTKPYEWYDYDRYNGAPTTTNGCVWLWLWRFEFNPDCWKIIGWADTDEYDFVFVFCFQYWGPMTFLIAYVSLLNSECICVSYSGGFFAYFLFLVLKQCLWIELILLANKVELKCYCPNK